MTNEQSTNRITNLLKRLAVGAALVGSLGLSYHLGHEAGYSRSQVKGHSDMKYCIERQIGRDAIETMIEKTNGRDPTGYKAVYSTAISDLFFKIAHQDPEALVRHEVSLQSGRSIESYKK